MTNVSDTTVGPAPEPSPSPSPVTKAHHFSLALRPPQKAALAGFSARYGPSQTILIHMLIDMESDTHRLPAAILKALRQTGTRPPAPPAPAAPLFVNN